MSMGKRSIQQIFVVMLWWSGTLCASEFVGPAVWQCVHTNSVQAWQASQQSRATSTCRVWPGVIADKQKREVRFLAEAVGHKVGTMVEFLFIGPWSDRAYEALAVSIAQPGDIARAVEYLGIKRGGGVGSRPFRFWPCGERISFTFSRVDAVVKADKAISRLISEAQTDAPLIDDRGFVFTGGIWSGTNCLTDTVMPCSVFALYNEPGTIFDNHLKADQGEVYGRLTVAEDFKQGELIEIVVRPLKADGVEASVLHTLVRVELVNKALSLTCVSEAGEILQQGTLAEMILWAKSQAEAGRDHFMTLEMADTLPLMLARQVAGVFEMLDGKGLKLDGKTEKGLYPKAFLPLEKWRQRDKRDYQPFELHVSKKDDGGVAKKLVFIEEDWNVAGFEPKLIPREYNFEAWEELPDLVARLGDPAGKNKALFVFVPSEVSLDVFMPGVRALAERLPQVYIFSE